MTVTEFAILKLKDGVTWQDIFPIFSKAADGQTRQSGHKQHIFDDADTPDRFYNLSGWASVAAHEAWLANAENQEAIRGLTPLLEVERVLHSTIEPDSIWDAIEELYFMEGEQAALVVDVAGQQPIWTATGEDAEGKTTASHRFVGYAQPLDDAIRSRCATGMRRLRRHDMEPGSLN